MFPSVFSLSFHSASDPSLCAQAYFQAAAPEVSLVMRRVDEGEDKCVTEQRPLTAVRGFGDTSWSNCLFFCFVLFFNVFFLFVI